MLKKLDIYIIKKFLGTFFFSIILIISIAIVFDISEHIEDFIEKDAPLKAIIFEHYLTFIPYFTNLFSSLFIFIAVIFFTSKMAYNTEIIAILSSGISFRRFLWPYFLSALFLAIFSFFLSSYIIPPANKIRLEFENKYIRNKFHNFDKDIHKQIEPGLFVYMDNYNVSFLMGYKFCLEKFEDGKLKSKLTCDYVKWDTITNKWSIYNYRIRNIDGIEETIIKGSQIDTVINLHPSEFSRRETIIETMNYNELNEFIDKQMMQGSENIKTYLVYKYQRLAYPFSTFILTLIGVTLATRKVKGGIGIHIGIGIALSFAYILFMQFSTNFAIGGTINPLLAVWIPNIVFSFIGLLLYRIAPK